MTRESFSEKYRNQPIPGVDAGGGYPGDGGGYPGDPPTLPVMPSDSIRPSGGRRRTLTWALTLVLFVAAGAGLAFVLAGRMSHASAQGPLTSPATSGAAALPSRSAGPGQSPSASAGATPDPSANAGHSGAPNASAKPSGAPNASAKSTPGPSASPGPALSADQQAFAAFQARMLAAAPSYRMTGVEQLSGGSVTIGFTSTWDVSGNNYRSSGAMTVTKQATRSVSVVRRGDRTWVRVGGQGWQTGTPANGTAPVPFLGILSRRDLASAGTVTRAGRTLYRFNSTDWYHPNVFEVVFSGIARTDDRLALLIDAAGRPVEATYHITGVYNGQQITGEGTLTFRDVGANITVTAP